MPSVPEQEDPAKNMRLVQLEEPEESQPTAIVTTTHGSFIMVLYPKEAPNTVAHFQKLVKEGFYNDKPVFRDKDIAALISGASDDAGAQGKVATEDGKKLKQETTPDLWHFSGAVSALAEPKSKISKELLSDSRFFIVGTVAPTADMAEEMKKYEYPDSVIEAYKGRGGMPQYTGSYTVFAQVISGMDIVDKILALQYDDQTLKAEDNTKIIKIELSEYHHGDPVDFTFQEPAASSSISSVAEGSSSK